MKRVVSIVIFVLLFAGLCWALLTVLARRKDPQTVTFLADANELIEALQGYRKFVGSFPSGSSIDIANTLSGQTESNKKVLLLATSLKKRNTKGEITDPWGTAVQFFFSQNTVVIRSAGPNGTFEDSSSPESDDLFRSDAN